jgi:hypothetical protein
MRFTSKDAAILWSVIVLAMGMLFGSGGGAAEAAGGPTPPDDACEDAWVYAIRGDIAAGGSVEGGENLRPSERRERLKRWRSLPPEQRRVLRERLKRLKRMDEADRQLYERRFRQWKALDPTERRRLLRKFDRWESLSPQEREAIRRRFRDN